MELAVGKDIFAVCGKCGDTWHVRFHGEAAASQYRDIVDVALVDLGQRDPLAPSKAFEQSAVVREDRHGTQVTCSQQR